MRRVSIIFHDEGILADQGGGPGSQGQARRIDTRLRLLPRHMEEKRIILISDLYLKTSVYVSEPLILLEEKLFFICPVSADDVHGSGKNEVSHLHHDRHPDMSGRETSGSDGWDNRTETQWEVFMAKIINMQEMQQRASGPSGGRKQKVRFIISREFVGHQTMEDAFSHLIERRTEDHYQRWREEQEAALQSGQETLLKAG